MNHSDGFLRTIGIEFDVALRQFSEKSGVSVQALKYYDEANLVPSGRDLLAIIKTARISEFELMLKMGRLDRRLTTLLQSHAEEIYELIKNGFAEPEGKQLDPVFHTSLGRLYQGDCLDLLPTIQDDSVDLIFADPPFNLKKLYPSGMDDNLKCEQYMAWCEQWARECVRILKPGGSFFIWNLPKWNTSLAGYLNTKLTFRHWISVDIKYSLPIQGRLYPSHYSLLYYCKGPKPRTFHPDRLPMSVCPNCKADLNDYGGYKDKMNPQGINLTDVWFDIPPVRHAKYKKRKGANELSVKLLDRIVEMASDEGDLVFDPFGGSGTTYIVSEIKKRRWIGIELGPVEDIVRRFDSMHEDAYYLGEVRRGLNHLFSEDTIEARLRKGLWTCETVREKSKESVTPKQLMMRSK
jgi:site-specific DNA-methyltransferase (adenine-specific)